VLGVGKVFVIVTKSSDRLMLARHGNPAAWKVSLPEKTAAWMRRRFAGASPTPNSPKPRNPVKIVWLYRGAAE
jgi:hypothetical protein